MARGNPVQVSPDTLLTDETVELVAHWLRTADERIDRADAAPISRLRRLIEDDAGRRFAMLFVDRVTRPDDQAAAAAHLSPMTRGRIGVTRL